MAKRNWLILAFVVFLLIASGVGIFWYLNPNIFADYYGQSEYVLFTNDNFDYVYPSTEPDQSQLIGQAGIDFYAAKGEIEPINFSVRSKIDLGKVDITISDLTGPSGSKLASSNVEIFNEKVWRQCYYRNPSASINKCDLPDDPNHQEFQVPELLVKDNQQNIISDEVGLVDGIYTPPSLNQDFNVIVNQDQTHTFYLRFRLPQDIEPGNYSGKVTFSPQNSGNDRFSVNLKVLPFSLPQSRRDIMVYYNQQPGGEETGLSTVSQATYRKYLEFFKESGLTGIHIYPNSTDQAKWIANQMRAIGFNRQVVVHDNYKGNHQKINIGQVKNYFENKGFEVYFFGDDEPWNPEQMRRHLQESIKIHKSGGKVITGIRKECYDAMLDPKFKSEDNIFNDPFAGYSDSKLVRLGIEPVERVDLPAYSAVTNVGQWCLQSGQNSIEKITLGQYLNGLWDGSVSKNYYKEAFYRNIWPEEASVNRASYGFFFSASGLDGAYMYGVESYYPTMGTKQYDDFDAHRKNLNAVYPSQEGPVLTMQWEGAREGIDDVRYQTKLEQLLDRLAVSDETKASRIRARLKTKLSPYKWGDGVPWFEVDDRTNQSTRDWIKDQIINILPLVEDSETVCGDGICGLAEDTLNCPSDCTGPEAMVAGWTFDQGKGFIASDITTVNSGTLKNMTDSNWLSGGDCKSGACLSFDGSDDYVYLADTPSLDLKEEFTIGSWLKLTKTNQTGALFLKNRTYGLYFKEGDLYFATWSPDGQLDSRPFYKNFPLNTWVHISAVFKNGAKKLYANGTLVGSETPNYTSIIRNNITPQIGGQWEGGVFKGAIDNLYIFDKAKNRSEIEEMMGLTVDVLKKDSGYQISQKTNMGNTDNKQVSSEDKDNNISKQIDQDGDGLARNLVKKEQFPSYKELVETGGEGESPSDNKPKFNWVYAVTGAVLLVGLIFGIIYIRKRHSINNQT